MAKKVRKLILPFAVPAEDREKAFDKNMEKAAVFCLAEIERKKDGGLLKRKEAGEELLFVSKFCYPVWLVPWKGKSLIFDGFGTTAHAFKYKNLPDVDAFIKAIEVSAKTREAYSAFLSDRLNFFKSFVGEEEQEIRGLIADPELVQDFTAYLGEAKVIRKTSTERAHLSPALDQSTISSLAQDVTDLRANVKEDIQNLQETMKILTGTTEEQVKAIRERIRETQKQFDEKIRSLKSSLVEKASRIRKKYDQEITRRTKEIERRLHRLHQKRVKLEKAMESTTARIKRCEAEIRSSRLSKDETSELRWREELENCKKKLSDLEKTIEDVDTKIEKSTSSKKQEISKIRVESDEKVEATMREVSDVEAARDAKIRMSEEEIETLEDSTATIVDQINNLVEKKRAALEKLKELGIRKRIRKYALVHLPFYLVCYQQKLENRCILYPPSVASSMGVLTKFKGVFGVSKTKSLLQPRSKNLTSLLNELMPLIEQNPVFEKEVIDAGIKVNLLRSKASRKNLKKGLEALKEEKWISEGEFQTFKESLKET